MCSTGLPTPFSSFPVLVYIVWNQRAKIHYYLIGGILGGLPFLWYNYVLFGNVFGGYAEDLSLFAVNAGFAGHFLGLLFSPNGGLFIFCPALLLSIAGFYVICSKGDSPVRTILLVSGLAVLLEIFLYSFWNALSSSTAFCFGPRYLTGLVPFLCLYTGYFLEDWFGTGKTGHQGPIKWLAITVVGGLIISSVCIQIIGVFFYGYSSDANLTMNDERAWNVTDSLIIRSYTEGSQKIPGVSVFILPPLSPLFAYNFPGKSTGG